MCFENLRIEDYGSLLAALDPRLLDDPDQHEWAKTVTSVGGGKPFGFGAVNIDVAVEWVQTAAFRYLGRGEPAPSIPEAMSAFRTSVPRQVTATWEALRHVLEFGFIPDSLVWYPPGPGVKGDPDFDHSFEFFSRTTGLAFREKVHELTLLPLASVSSEGQVLDSTAGERPLDPDQTPRGSQQGHRGGPAGGRRG